MENYKEIVKALDIKHQENLNEDALKDILKFYSEETKEKQASPFYKVFNAWPGHGKTTALKLFLANILLNEKKKIESEYKNFSALIVLREISQMKEMEDFLRRFTPHIDSVRYVESANYNDIDKDLRKTRILIISHERFKRLGMGVTENLKVNESFLYWKAANGKDYKRLIIVDERPSFQSGFIFTLDDGLKWLGDCFKELDKIDKKKDRFTVQDKTIIRSLISILIAKELSQFPKIT